MTQTRLIRQIDQRLTRLLAAHHVEVLEPRDRMLQLSAVPAGKDFSKPCTNALLRERPPASAWQAFVDEDLHYAGGDAQRKALFGGARRRGWLELTPAEPVVGSVTQAVLWLLDQLQSPLRPADVETVSAAHERVGTGTIENEVTERDEVGPSADGQPSRPPLDASLERVGRFLAPAQLPAEGFRPTEAQADWIARAAETVTRGAAPQCPLLLGPSGCGKSVVARAAAGELLRRGAVRRVLEVHGAAVCSGAIFWPERDERLRQTLEAAMASQGILVVMEEFDLAITRSEAAAALVAESLDRGLRLIAVARPEMSLRQLSRATLLARRLEPIAAAEPDHDEMLRILADHAAGHPRGKQVELAREVLPLVLSLAARRPGADPGASLGLLEAVINHAAFSGLACVGPDDVYHLVRQEDD